MENVSDLDAKEPVETELKVANVFSGMLNQQKDGLEKRVVVLTSRDYETLED